VKHFKWSFIIASIGLITAFLYGGLSALYVVTLLSLLEVSLSFDNAVVNAKVLETMDLKWQQRFITFGLPIAVFGMRFLFPIVIVQVVTGLGFVEVFSMASSDPVAYKAALDSSINYIYSFGGSFLLMVGMSFFFDEDKKDHWFNLLENNKLITSLSKLPSIEITISMFIAILLMSLTEDHNVGIAFVSGVLLYSLLNMLDEAFSSMTVKNGLIGLLYLEVLDASFSFDGVIGAFAISSDIWIITMGLGIGAFFVRSLTLYLVEEKTLTEYVYLEHGAHYAIVFLGGMILVKMFVHIGEEVTGTIGIAFIVLAFWHSIKHNKTINNNKVETTK